jgi:hypothetical protein
MTGQRKQDRLLTVEAAVDRVGTSVRFVRLMHCPLRVPVAGRFAAATSGALSAGPLQSPQPAPPACISVISAIPATRWPVRAGRACGT